MDVPVLIVMPLAFCCEFIDSSLGMGYGTVLTPILLLMGYEPLQVVPAVLFSEFVTGITAAFFHHSVENVNLKPHTKEGKVALVLSIFGVIGVVASVLVTVNLPRDVLKICIGVIVLSMGVYLLASLNRPARFSWVRITLLGTIASFNKGMSGGGYGPLVTGGQMVSGVGVKGAVGITSLSEGVTCLIGVIVYYLIKSDIDWILAPWLMAGAVLSVPLAAHTLKRIPEKKARFAVACFILLLGVVTLVKVLV